MINKYAVYLNKKYPEYNYSKFNPDSSNDKSILICNIHGEFKYSYISAMSHNTKDLCPSCIKDKRANKNKEIFLHKMNMKFPELDFSKFIYVNEKTKGIVICKEHGELLLTPSRLKNSKSGCQYCSNKRTLNHLEKLKEMHPDYIFPNFKYIKSYHKHKVICPAHGAFYMTYNHLSRGHGCRKCNSRYSSYEKEIVLFIKSFYNKTIEENNRNIILNEYSNNYMELDIYLPDISLAIEFNGTYWHSDDIISNKRKYFNSAKDYHEYKSIKCKEKGITLLHINEEEYIRDRIGMLNSIKNIIQDL